MGMEMGPFGQIEYIQKNVENIHIRDYWPLFNLSKWWHFPTCQPIYPCIAHSCYFKNKSIYLTGKGQIAKIILKVTHVMVLQLQIYWNNINSMGLKM